MCWVSKRMAIRGDAGSPGLGALPPVCEWLQVEPLLFSVPGKWSYSLLLAPWLFIWGCLHSHVWDTRPKADMKRYFFSSLPILVNFMLLPKSQPTWGQLMLGNYSVDIFRRINPYFSCLIVATDRSKRFSFRNSVYTSTKLKYQKNKIYRRLYPFSHHGQSASIQPTT